MKKSKFLRDGRIFRPIHVIEKKSGRSVFAQKTESFKVNDVKFNFFTPNNISLFVNISKKERDSALNIYNRLITLQLKENKKKFLIEDNQLTLLYNYFEHIQICIIAVFTAIESLSNAAIPNSFEYKKESKNSIIEVFNKEAIERNLKTSDKLSKIFPLIYPSANKITSLPFWSQFKELEELRNDIIHQKTALTKKTDTNTSIFTSLLSQHLFKKIEAGYSLIEYLCNQSETHENFPLIFGHTNVEPIEVDDFSEYFIEEIKD